MPLLDPKVAYPGAGWDEDGYIYHEENGVHKRAWSDDEALYI